MWDIGLQILVLRVYQQKHIIAKLVYSSMSSESMKWIGTEIL